MANKVRYKPVHPSMVKQGDRISGKLLQNVLSVKSYNPLVVVMVEHHWSGSWIIHAVRADNAEADVVRLARYPYQHVAVEIKP